MSDDLACTARRSVDELLQSGVTFRVTRRIDGSAGFTWALPCGDRSRIRRVISDAKHASVGYWVEFEKAVLAVAEIGGDA